MNKIKTEIFDICGNPYYRILEVGKRNYGTYSRDKFMEELNKLLDSNKLGDNHAVS